MKTVANAAVSACTYTGLCKDPATCTGAQDGNQQPCELNTDRSACAVPDPTDGSATARAAAGYSCVYIAARQCTTLLSDQPIRIDNNLDNSFTVQYENQEAVQHLVTVEYPIGSGRLTTDSPKRFQVFAAAPHGGECEIWKPEGPTVWPGPGPDGWAMHGGPHADSDTTDYNVQHANDRDALPSSTFLVGEQQHFIIRTRDVMQNIVEIGGANVRISMRLDDASDTFNSPVSRFTVFDTGDGTYYGNYTNTRAGNFSIFVSVNEVPLPVSPLQVFVQPGAADYRQTTSQGFGIAGGYANVPIGIELVAHDAYGNLVAADPSIEYMVKITVGCMTGTQNCGPPMTEPHPSVMPDDAFRPALDRIRTSEIESRLNTVGGGLEIPVVNRVDPEFTSAEFGVTAQITYMVYEVGFYTIKIQHCRVPQTRANEDDPCLDPQHVRYHHVQFMSANVTLPADANASFAYGSGLQGTVAGIETMFAVDLRNAYGVPQPVGVDIGDEVTAVLIPVSGNPVVARTQGVCCDDHVRVRVSTNGLYNNCSDALAFLSRAGLDCTSDLGVRSPFRFLSDPCPAVCETCISNCDSKVLIFYRPFIAGLYALSVRVNGNEMPTSAIMVMPGALSPAYSSVNVVTRFASAGEIVEATLTTKDVYNNSKPYTDEEALVTAKVIAYAPATNWYGMVSVNHNDGTTTLTAVPEISSAYSLSVYFNGVLATEAVARTRCGHVASTAVCVSPGVPAASLDMAAVGRSRYVSASQTIAGSFAVEITPVDSYGNEHSGPDDSCPGSGNCFSCLAYDVSDPQTYISDIDAAYNYADLDGHYIATMNLQTTGNFRVLCYLQDSSGSKFPLTSAPLAIQVDPGPISSQQTRVTGEGLIRAVAGQEQVMTVTTRDQYGNEVTNGNAVFSGTLRGPLMVPITFGRIAGGQFTATYTATASGDYIVSIMRGGGEPIDESPWGPPNAGLTVAPAVVEAAMCTFVDHMCPTLPGATAIYTDICDRNMPGRQATAEAGQNFTFAVVSRDHYTNILVNGGDFILATAQRSDSFRLISGQTTDNIDGTYTIQFNIFQTGLYSMRTVVSALDIADSPFALTITPAVVVPAMTCGSGLDGSGNPCTVNTNRNGCDQLTGSCRYVPGSAVTGTGRLYAIAGIVAPLTITAYDRFTNPSGNLGQAGTFIVVSVMRGAIVDVISYVSSATSTGIFDCPFTTQVSTANALLVVHLGGQVRQSLCFRHVFVHLYLL